VDIYKGNSWYVPDYYIKKSGIFIEVKGRMDDRSKYKLSRFINKYPSHLVLINGKAMRRMKIL
jgi:hypothetical protein